MLKVSKCREVTMWAAVDGIVLSVVAQIVAAKTLGEGVGRLVKDDFWKDASG